MMRTACLATLSIALQLTLAGCDDDPKEPAADTADVAVEVTPDATPEVTPDATPEVTPDATAEVTPDATAEVTPDATAEVTPDATAEVTPDATPDTVEDAAPDTTPEVTPDTMEDAAPDTTPEVTPDTTEDAAPDTAPEVTPDTADDTRPDTAEDTAPDTTLDVETSEPGPKKSATATCGASSGFGFLAGVLADFTPDGSLVTTNTPIDNCWLTTQVGTLPGGTTVNNGADSATCGGLACTESNNLCNAFGGVPASAGSPVTVTLTDVLLGGTVSHTFPVAPGSLMRSTVGGSISRGAPLTITTSGGLAGTLTLVTIQQDNPDGQTTVICEYPANSPSVSVPTSILGLFHDGPFNLLVDTRVQEFSVHNGYDVVLVVVNSTTPQQSTFVP